MRGEEPFEGPEAVEKDDADENFALVHKCELEQEEPPELAVLFDERFI